MNKKRSYLQVFFSYFIMLIPELLNFLTKTYSNDLFLICFIIALFVIIDAKMRYNNFFIKINYWIFSVLFIVFLVFLLI